MRGTVEAVSRSSGHDFSKGTEESIRLVEGQGVEGDAHCGVTVKHRSRVRVDPSQPNLRQVHLIHGELHDELAEEGFEVRPGDIGENVTTRGVDLLGLPRGAKLSLGAEAVVEITGRRNPCAQLDGFQQGLLSAVLGKGEHGETVFKAGIMGIVLAGGEVRPGDAIRVEVPPEPHLPLERV